MSCDRRIATQTRLTARICDAWLECGRRRSGSHRCLRCSFRRSCGFGLDSLIEIFASVVVVWQLTGVNQHRERMALRLIGSAFIALVIYIAAQLIFSFVTGTHAVTSLGGIVWIAATFLTMLLLAFGKRTTGQQLKNEVLLTEGRVTLVDAYLAGAVLVGLLLNALFGWWWADPLASLVIVYYGIREAIHALRESAAQHE